MKNFLFIFFFIPFFLFTQEKGTFMLDVETNYMTFNPSELNKIINDKDFVGSEAYDYADFKKGISYGIQLSYNFFTHLNMGLYGEYQRETIEQNQYNFIEYSPNNVVKETILKELSLSTYSFGLQTALLLNTFSFWKDHAVLSKMETNINVQMGYGRAFFSTNSRMIPTEEMNVHNNGMGFYNNVYYSDGFQLIMGLKLGYILTQNNYFSSIGLKVGYQYFKASNLRQGENKATPMYNQNIKLNLSGFSIGVYLTVGK